MNLIPSQKSREPELQFESAPFKVLNGTVYFSGVCDECRPHCGAICCRVYGYVSLTEEEAKSGQYAYMEVTDGCNCEVCKRMRELGIRYTLLKQPDGSCIYLDGSRRCSIYEKRPQTCRNYSCRNVAFSLTP